MKNLGSQPIASVVIDEITVGGMIITQRTSTDDGLITSPHGQLTLTGLEHDGDSNTSTLTQRGGAGVACANVGTFDNAFLPSTGSGPTCMAAIQLTGFSHNDVAADQVRIGAGESQSFRIVITGLSTGTNDFIVDILRTVPASTELFISVTGTDGSTTTISEPRTTRVTQR